MRKSQRKLAFAVVFVAVVSLGGLSAQTNVPQRGTPNVIGSSKGGARKTGRSDQRGVTPVDSTAASPFSTGTYYALAIGNNDYTYLGKLKTAINDAAAVAQLLQTRYGFETKLLKNATRSDIMTALADYRQTLKENSNLLIY